MEVKYITYQIKGLHSNNTPIAVDVKGLSIEKQQDILNDAISLHGLYRVNINRNGKVRKDAIIIDVKEHYKYDWGKLADDYYNRMFNPKNFITTVSDFYNKVLKELDAKYFPDVKYYGDNKKCAKLHYQTELFSNGCLRLGKYLTNVAKLCNDTEVNISTIVDKYILK